MPTPRSVALVCGQVLWSSSWHQCATLPCMSNKPQSFGFSVPTGCVCSGVLSQFQPYSVCNCGVSP